jgi:hypothetical protein
MPKKSYWQSAYIGNERSQEAIRSWFSPMADGLTANKAEILCDIETDREKKLRAFMTNAEGQHFQLERTLGGRTFSISKKRIAMPVTHTDPQP